MLRYGRALHIIIITASCERACAARNGANKKRHQKRRRRRAFDTPALFVFVLSNCSRQQCVRSGWKISAGEAERRVLFAQSSLCVCTCIAENWMILLRQKMHACCNLWPGKIEWPPPTPPRDSDLQPGQSSRTMTREWKVWHWQVARVRRERTPAVWNSKLFRSLQRDSRFIWRGSVT